MTTVHPSLPDLKQLYFFMGLPFGQYGPVSKTSEEKQRNAQVLLKGAKPVAQVKRVRQ